MPPKPKPAPNPTRSPNPAHTPIHPLYAILLLTIEPLTAVAGALAAGAYPAAYLRLTHAPSAPPYPLASPPLATHTALAQLANLYLLFALNEALVLRAAASLPRGPLRGWLVPARGVAVDVRVWRAVLAVLLVADVGHLWSVGGLGMGVYWCVWEWNAMAWGNVGVVYAGAAMRCCFLLGVGVG